MNSFLLSYGPKPHLKRINSRSFAGSCSDTGSEGVVLLTGNSDEPLVCACLFSCKSQEFMHQLRVSPGNSKSVVPVLHTIELSILFISLVFFLLVLVDGL